MQSVSSADEVRNPPTEYEQASRFLTALSGSDLDPFVFQTFPDGDGECEVGPQVLVGSLPECWHRLIALNDFGHGIFVTVNETRDGSRKGADVVRLRALFVDKDGGDLPRLELAPNIIVSSGGGEHAYWLLADGEPLEAFTPAQRGLAAKLDTDPAVSDLSRVMRLPGTLHLKDRSRPVPVELVWAKGEPRYTISEVLSGLGASPSAPSSRGGEAGFSSSSPGRRALDPFVLERARRYVRQIRAVEGQGGDAATFRVACALVRDFALRREDAWALLQEWNQTNAEPPWELPDLGEKLVRAERYGQRERGAALASSAPPAVAAAQPGAPNPATFCFDLSLSKWRRWSRGGWSDGITDTALSRYLENEAGMDKPTREAWRSQVRVVVEAKPVYSSGEPFAEEDGEWFANTFRPPTLRAEPGSFDPISAVLLNLVDNDPEAFRWVLGWIGKVVQAVYSGRPARVGTAPVFHGAKGAGKGVLEEVLKALLGRWNVVSIAQADLDSSFNSYLDGKLLVCADEVWSSEHRSQTQVAKLKNLITSHERLVNRKGEPQYTRTCVENWVFFSNSHRPLEVERGDRRFTVLRTGPAIPVELGARVADDARTDGPLVRAFLAHLLAMPREQLVADYRPLQTAAKAAVERASGNSATKFAAEVAERGFYSVTGSWAAGGLTRDLYLENADGYRTIRVGEREASPVILRRRLMEVFRAYCQEIGAPATQETTLVAALRDLVPGLVEAELLVDGRRERVVAGLPGMLPDTREAVFAPAENPLPTQRSLL